MFIHTDNQDKQASKVIWQGLHHHHTSTFAESQYLAMSSQKSLLKSAFSTGGGSQIWKPYNTRFLGPAGVCPPHSILISSAVFAQLSRVPNTQTTLCRGVVVGKRGGATPLITSEGEEHSSKCSQYQLKTFTFPNHFSMQGAKAHLQQLQRCRVTVLGKLFTK